MSVGGYPLGAQYDSSAPYNKKDVPEKEIEVLVSITLSKTVKIKVSDYTISNSGKDEDGDYFETLDFSNFNLKKAVEDQLVLPNEAYRWVTPFTLVDANARKNLEDWNVDEFEVILDN